MLKCTKWAFAIPRLYVVCGIWLGIFFSFFNTAHAADIRVMKTGLGEGTINATGISCGNGGSDCSETGLSGSFMLSVSVPAGSNFTSWGGDCSGSSPTCTTTMDQFRSVRANFEKSTTITPLTMAEIGDVAVDGSRSGIGDYLANPLNADVDTPAEFIAALPAEFRQNWILMTRSESLQTGTAKYPRILLFSADSKFAFTVALTAPSFDGSGAQIIEPPFTSYPGAHPNAIEFMQWDAGEKNFRFHEVILDTIPELTSGSSGSISPVVYEARSRSVTPDDAKCFACHSTRNILNRGSTPGTTGSPIGLVKFKNKPNWDTYDSWGGMLAFSRDRIFKDSVEAANFRKMFNLWTWQSEPDVREIVEQLELQPPGTPDATSISRTVFSGGVNDGHIVFGFDPDATAVTTEGMPGGPIVNIDYSFDRLAGTTSSQVNRDSTFGSYVTLHHSDNVGGDEGRAVDFFDHLGGLDGNLNAIRVGDELAHHRYVTGSVSMDIRPLALAINRSCYTVSSSELITDNQTIITPLTSTTASTAIVTTFFDTRNGMNFNDVYDDTRRRAQSLPRRKADITRATIERDNDEYVYDPTPASALGTERIDGTIREYGSGTLGISGGTGGLDQSIERLRQEAFRRNIDSVSHPDETVIGGDYPDVENDSTDAKPDNTRTIALYRYFLEPLGVSVDKWSMGVRGRSRTYTFADVLGRYTAPIRTELEDSLGDPGDPYMGTAITTPYNCTNLRNVVETDIFSNLPPLNAQPTYTDVQRIYNKSCIECHGGLGYPPYQTHGDFVNFAENETPDPGDRRLTRSHDVSMSLSTTNPATSYLYDRITDYGNLEHPYNPFEPYDISNPDNPGNPDVADERCPEGVMPCGGPPLSKADIETIGRWIGGGRTASEGDPHIKTIDGIHYDFQSAGEFTLLKGEGFELQARQTPVTTAGPLGPNAYTELSACVSVNSAYAMKIGGNRISYQPNRLGDIDNEKTRRLVLKVNGEPIDLDNERFELANGGHIQRTNVDDGIELLSAGGTRIVITPWWWDRHKIHVLNINLRNARGTQGVMGTIPPGTWLPALADGTTVGPKETNDGLRYQQLYQTFADSWRVDNATSLFDYEGAVSPASYHVATWPAFQEQNCVAPPLPNGPVPGPVPVELPLVEAEAVCAGVVDPNRRQNCVADVRATGSEGFAQLYFDTEELDNREAPKIPTLILPENNAKIDPGTVQFEWDPNAEEGTGVRISHCVWPSSEGYNMNNCVTLGGGSSGGGLGGLLPGGPDSSTAHWICFILLLLIIITIIYLLIRYRRRAILPVLVLIVLAILIWVLFCRLYIGVSKTARDHSTELENNRVYYWKVIAESENGMVTESKTFRLVTKE